MAKAERSDAVKSRLAAVGWLQRQGYKVNKTKLYSDCKKGLLRVQDDGSILVRDLVEYISRANLNQLSNETRPTQELDELSLQERSSKAEREYWQSRREKLRYEREIGRYIPREDVELELASRAALFERILRRRIRERAIDWIELVGGDTKKNQELIADMFKELDAALNEYANTDHFQVLFTEK